MKTWAPENVARDGRPGEGLRVAVAGASHWHLPRHAEFLRAAGATFVAVSDHDPAVAERWAGELGCRAVPDAGAIVDARPDLVLALGRVCDMAEQAQVLLSAGLPLLAEKPLGCNAAEVAPLAGRVAAKGGWVSVALVQRYDPLWTILDELRESGRLGNLAHAHLHIINGPPQRYAAWGSGWMLEPATAGGGALVNLGIHGIDYFHHLTGEPATVAGAAIGSLAHGEAIEDFGAVTLVSESGVVGTVEAGYTYPDAAAGMTRNGDNEIRIGASGAYVTAREAEVVLVTADGEQHYAAARAGDRYRDWAFDSLARFRAGQPPLASVADCLAAVRQIDAAYQLAGRSPPTPDFGAEYA
ncbi:MAG: Gfo/Idh/MocA family oxidoreductase [Chloroflexi bacterium]|nr:Gfo/Idh/MocA family oxidoreductase [Chloroflexota bacterium]